METIHERDKSYRVPQVPAPVQPEFDIVTILKKIHFWVRFLSVVTITGIILFLISQVFNFCRN